MYFQDKLWMAGYYNREGSEPVALLPKMANRHGLITGATGTGKTTTVKVLAETFSDAGVPVFVADVKGDLSGMSEPGVLNDNMQERISRFGLDDAGFDFHAYPTTYWDVYGEKGVPVRASIYDMGSLLLSKIMDLTEAQEGILNIVYRISKDEQKWIYDLADLRAMVQYVGDNAAQYKTKYGNITTASIGGIQRGLLKLEDQEAAKFFGKPALDINDWIRCDENGRGMINVLNCEKLFQNHDLYASFLVWMLNELYNRLPEVGDLEKPKIVYFFDEAHLLFNINSKQLLEKVEQVVRLIRSKGVGVYFISQSPTDIPNTVMAQLGNKIQHALRAYTPADQKIVKAAAQSFVVNPEFDTEEVIPQLGTGEALVSFLNEKGVPTMVQRANILPPQSYMGTLEDDALQTKIANCDMNKYIRTLNEYSACDQLAELAQAKAAAEGTPEAQAAADAYTQAQAAQAQAAGYAPGQQTGYSAAPQAGYVPADAAMADPTAQTAQADAAGTTQNQTQALIEKLRKEKEEAQAQAAAIDAEKAELEKEKKEMEKEKAKLEKENAKLEKENKKKKNKKSSTQKELEKAGINVAKNVGSSLARNVIKNLFK